MHTYERILGPDTVLVLSSEGELFRFLVSGEQGEPKN